MLLLKTVKTALDKGGVLKQGLEKIIQRDFFPDVSKLQAQRDYLQAEEDGDTERMREIAIKYGSAMAKYTPRTYVPRENTLALQTLSHTLLFYGFVNVCLFVRL